MRYIASLFWIGAVSFAVATNARALEREPAAPPNCRTFVDHVLGFQDLSMDSVRRWNFDVSDRTDSADAPWITIVPGRHPEKTASAAPGAKAPRPFSMITGANKDGSWQLNFKLPPMKDYTFHFQSSDHSCQLKSIEVNGTGHPYTARECAKFDAAPQSAKPNVLDACSIGAGYFVTEKAPSIGSSASDHPKHRKSGVAQ